MGWFDHFPGTNFHELNLDWIINTIKKLQNRQWMQYKELRTGLDSETDHRVQADNAILDALKTESETRAEADALLKTQIDNETAARVAGDTALQANIDAEANVRSETDALLLEQIQNETAARIAGDEALKTALDAEAKTRADADELLRKSLEAETENRVQAIESEKQRAEAAEKALDEKIDAETDRAKAEEQRIDQKLDKEITDRTEAVAAEQQRAEAAEKALDEKITAETNRATTKENELDGKITAETNRATAKENELDGKITAETERATEAETALGQRIDDLSSATDTKLTDYIRKDGTTATTAAIPFAKGIKVDSIVGTTEAGVAIEAPLDLNLHQITGVADATDPMGAVNFSQMQKADDAVLAEAKQYTDEHGGGGGTGHGIPAGGTTGQVLAKSTDTDYTVAWTDPQAGPQGPAGPAGEAGPQGPAGPGVAAGGTAGQVLSKVDGADYNTQWVDVPAGEGTVPHLSEYYQENPLVGKREALFIGQEAAPQIVINSKAGANSIELNNEIGKPTLIVGPEMVTIGNQPSTLNNPDAVVTKGNLDDSLSSIEISGIKADDKFLAINNAGAIYTNATGFNATDNITFEGNGRNLYLNNTVVEVPKSGQLKVANPPTADTDVVNKAYVDNPAADLITTINNLGFFKKGNVVYAKYTSLVETNLTDIGTPVFTGTRQFRQILNFDLTDVFPYIRGKTLASFSTQPTNTLVYINISPTIISANLEISVVAYQKDTIVSVPKFYMPYDEIIAMWI